MKAVIAEIKRDQIRMLAEHGKREDGRGLTDLRNIYVESGIIGTAEGSARVQLGKTELIVGIKMAPGAPYPDHPEEGTLKTGLEMKPMAHPDLGSGAPKPETVEHARVIDRGIRESGTIDFRALCIEPGKEVWNINMDIQAIDYNGNVIDAATIGCVVALKDTIVPANRFGLGEDHPLPVKNWPVSVSFVKVGDCLLVDPTAAEESVAEARLTVSTDLSGDIRAMQKSLSGAFLYEQITLAIDRAVQTGGLVRQKLRQD